MGYVPDYYRTIKTAKYLGVAPWELVKQSLFWRKAAEIVEGAENEARQWWQTELDKNNPNNQEQVDLTRFI